MVVVLVLLAGSAVSAAIAVSAGACRTKGTGQRVVGDFLTEVVVSLERIADCGGTAVDVVFDAAGPDLAAGNGAWVGWRFNFTDYGAVALPSHNPNPNTPRCRRRSFMIEMFMHLRRS